MELSEVVQANISRAAYVTANANQQQYRDEVGELIADYVVNVSGGLDARAERAAKAALIDSIAVAPQPRCGTRPRRTRASTPTALPRAAKAA